MAKAPTKTVRPLKRGAKNSGGGLALLGMVALFAAVILMLVSMASLVLVVFGMLPTFVAVLIDRSPQRFAFISVLAMNFAGVFPYLLDLWMGSNSMSVAIDSLTDVFSLFTMYGSAAVGWVLFIVTPPIVTTVMTFIAQRRVALLRANQKRLLNEWGDDIAQSIEGAEEGEEKAGKEPGAPPSAPKGA